MQVCIDDHIKETIALQKWLGLKRGSFFKPSEHLKEPSFWGRTRAVGKKCLLYTSKYEKKLMEQSGFCFLIAVLGWPQNAPKHVAQLTFLIFYQTHSKETSFWGRRSADGKMPCLYKNDQEKKLNRWSGLYLFVAGTVWPQNASKHWPRAMCEHIWTQQWSWHVRQPLSYWALLKLLVLVQMVQTVLRNFILPLY